MFLDECIFSFRAGTLERFDAWLHRGVLFGVRFLVNGYTIMSSMKWQKLFF
jgi:hypothetical protein